MIDDKERKRTKKGVQGMFTVAIYSLDSPKHHEIIGSYPSIEEASAVAEDIKDQLFPGEAVEILPDNPVPFTPAKEKKP